MTVRHGLAGYQSDRCRCAVCRAAWAEYHRDYMRRRALNAGKPLRGPAPTEAEREAAAVRSQQRSLGGLEAARAREINARTRSLGREGRVSARELSTLVDAYGGVCAYCGRPWEEIDHLIPLSRGGPSSVENLRPVCRSCNRRKRTQRLEEWKPWLNFKPANMAPNVLDRLRRKPPPDVNFGPASPRRRRFEFPTVGWDRIPPYVSEAGIWSGGGFLLFEGVHIPQIEAAGGVVTKVAGTTYYKRPLQAPGFTPGMALFLIPHPSNPHDENAVGVWDAYRRKQAGWIPSHLSEAVAEGIKSGKLSHAMCLWEWVLDDERVGIRILVAPGPPYPKCPIKALADSMLPAARESISCGRLVGPRREGS